MTEWRRLDCGCWERWIEGDIVTDRAAEWLVVVLCLDHAVEIGHAVKTEDALGPGEGE